MNCSDPFTVFTFFTNKVRICVWQKQTPTQPNVYILTQVHGNNIQIIADAIKPNAIGDGAITNRQTIPLAVRWADCQNFVLYEPTVQAIGVIHAGWQGLGKHVITAWFNTLHAKYNGKAQHTLVAGGPSLCTKCAEFSDPVTELPFADTQYISGRNVDLQAIAKQQLITAGVLPEHIEQSPICTKCNSKDWHSYRGSTAVQEQPALRNYTTIELLP